MKVNYYLLSIIFMLFLVTACSEDKIVTKPPSISNVDINIEEFDSSGNAKVTYEVTVSNNPDYVWVKWPEGVEIRDFELERDEDGIYRRTQTINCNDFLTEEVNGESITKFSVSTLIEKSGVDLSNVDTVNYEQVLDCNGTVDSEAKYELTITSFEQTSFASNTNTLNGLIKYSGNTATNAETVVVKLYPNGDAEDPIVLNKVVSGGAGDIPFTATDARLIDGSIVKIEISNENTDEPLFNFIYNNTTALSASDQITLDASMIKIKVTTTEITTYTEGVDITVNAERISNGDNIDGNTVTVILKNQAGQVVFTGTPGVITNGAVEINESIDGLNASTPYVFEYYVNYNPTETQERLGFNEFTTKPEMDITLSTTNEDTNSFNLKGNYTSFHRGDKEIVIELFKANGDFIKASNPITLSPSESISDFTAFFDELDEYAGQTLTIRVKRVDTNQYLDSTESTVELMQDFFTINFFGIKDDTTDIGKNSFIVTLNANNGTASSVTGKLRVFDGNSQVGTTRDVLVPANTNNHEIPFTFENLAEDLQGKTLALIIEWDNNAHPNSVAEVRIPPGEFTVSNLTVQSINETSFTLAGTATNTKLSTKTGKVYLFEEDGSLVNLAHPDITIVAGVIDDTFEVSYSNLPTDLQGQNVTVRIIWDDNVHSDTVAAVAIPMPEVNVDSFTISDETIKSAVANIQIDNPFTSSLPREDIQVRVYNSTNVLLRTFTAPADIPAMAVNDAFKIDLVGLKVYNGQTLTAKLFIRNEEKESENFTLDAITITGTINIGTLTNSTAEILYSYNSNDDINQAGIIRLTANNGTVINRNITFAAETQSQTITLPTVTGLGNFGPNFKVELIWSQENRVLDTDNDTLPGHLVVENLVFSNTTVDDVRADFSFTNTYATTQPVDIVFTAGGQEFYRSSINLGVNFGIGNANRTVSNQYGYAGQTIAVRIEQNGALLETASFRYEDVSVTNISTVRTRASFPSNNTSGVNMLYKRFTTDGMAPIETLSLFVKPAQTSSAFVQIQEIVSDIRVRFGSVEVSPFSITWTAVGNGYYRIVINLANSTMETGTGTRNNIIYVDMKTQNFSALGKSGNSFEVYATIEVDGVTYGENPGVNDVITITAP